MKKTARFFSIVLVVAMLAVCFTACGSTEDKQAGASDTVMIGGIGPLTGDHANYGTSNRNGAQMAVEEINAAGGVNGMKLSLDFQDSQADPDSAVNAYGKLLDSGMNVSLGGTFSGETASIVAAAKQDDMMILTPTASADKSIAGNDKAFRVCFTDSSQGTASADFMADNNLCTKVAVFYQSDIDYSVGLYNAFKEEAAVRGIEIVSEQTFTADTSTDFSTQIADIKNSGADLVFIPIYAAEASTLLTQASGKLDSNIIYFGCDGLDGILTKLSDASYAENVMMLTPFAADAPEENVQSFVSSYKEKYGATPDQFAADGYDAVYVLKAALEHANITDANDKEFTSKMVAAMQEITVEGVTGSMTWTADGETRKDAKAMIIHDGVAVLYGA